MLGLLHSINNWVSRSMSSPYLENIHRASLTKKITLKTYAKLFEGIFFNQIYWYEEKNLMKHIYFYHIFQTYFPKKFKYSVIICQSYPSHNV